MLIGGGLEGQEIMKKGAVRFFGYTVYTVIGVQMES